MILLLQLLLLIILLLLYLLRKRLLEYADVIDVASCSCNRLYMNVVSVRILQ